MIDQELRGALAALAEELPARQATAAVERLIANYRGTTPTTTPVLRDRADVVAYAAYRMPATFAAATAALDALAERTPGWTPASHLDVGGGTGAAVWAAEAVWPTPRTTHVLDWAEPALALGRELAARAEAETLRKAHWQRGSLRAAGRTADAAQGAAEGHGAQGGQAAAAARALPGADLVTLSYVLGELTPEDRRTTVEAAVSAARQAVVLVEPGTPDGYLRIIEARDALIAAGLRVLAPCPHSAACPIVPGEDWCHFATRVSRSSLHRRVKGGELAYEDEKFSYVAAVRGDPGEPAHSRVIRKPLLRKGQVILDLCEESGSLARRTITKRDAPRYRAARNTPWGAPWPPPAD
ncbi:small ribosomal subunit Rsm22 family protein [Streptomyces iconiensis]|uniref:Small ribosomal subunit Rsm22 family protein n=1 Tax=Streptomyces iconiensis TaxID=1384038 RepID=A0ABT6ZWM5_9ACTN|nr:small ribosomal subunit Rsm22 family protein [Streptomyces iconiensis]MDJ1133475.1 small ribosomal subunit Rsm22 family protein [Streptomyces iconiensis]